MAASAVAVVTERRVVRIGAVALRLACAATFVVPNPLGANATRLGMFVAAPLLVLTARRCACRSSALALPAHDLVAVVAGARRHRPCRARPLVGRRLSPAAVAAVASVGPLDGRVEVVPTRRHWETVYVASELPLARGWERQLDIGRNPIFYEADLDRATPTTAGCSTTRVRYVALADVAARPVRRRRGRPGPRTACRSSSRSGTTSTGCCAGSSMPRPLVEGPARLVQLGPGRRRARRDRAGPVLVRVRYSSHWSLDPPGLCRREPGRLDRACGRVTGRGDAPPGAGSQPAVIGPLDGCDDP